MIELDTDLDGLGDLADDNDGVEDSSDDFPLDASESVDTDGDGLGNNADLDDDDDTFTDEEELADGTDPLNRFSCKSNGFPEVTNGKCHSALGPFSLLALDSRWHFF